MERLLVVRASMGLDSLARLINIIRRGKIQVIEVSSRFGSDGEAEIALRIRGEDLEIEWVKKKILASLDVENVEVIQWPGSTEIRTHL
ncbi:MAG: hypothetical protein RQ885_10725 [Desulfurococcales archaeon]|jgi:hypothetical protein|nr:hypothetical protein [Desulfurococcales archaeon]